LECGAQTCIDCITAKIQNPRLEIQHTEVDMALALKANQTSVADALAIKANQNILEATHAAVA
jgi:hypothetical protein